MPKLDRKSTHTFFFCALLFQNHTPSPGVSSITGKALRLGVLAGSILYTELYAALNRVKILYIVFS